MSDWILLSKFLSELFYPANIALWLLLVAFLLLLFRRSMGAGITLFLALLVIVFGSSPIAKELSMRYRQQYPPMLIEKSPTADAIVLLAGERVELWVDEVMRLSHMLRIPISPQVEVGVGSKRVVHAMRLYEAGKGAIIIVSGGNTPYQDESYSEARYNAELLMDWGVPRDAILLEGKSRNTHENAVETVKILRERQLNQVLLVTSHYHMPRALAAFHAVGVSAIPSSSGFRPAELAQPRISDWIPSLNELGTLNRVIHEKLAILVYRSRGWIE